MTNTPHNKAPTMQGWIVKIGKGAHAGADFRIINWIDFGLLGPTEQMVADYEAERILLGDPADNNILIGWVSDTETILKHMNNLDLEQSRSKSPSTTGYVASIDGLVID